MSETAPQDERILSRAAAPEDALFERQLRPRSFAEYVGQEQAVASLRVSVEAAKQRGECVDHVLLYGPPGLGKTTLAGVIANEMQTTLVTTSGPAIERGGDLLGILSNLNEKDVLFIDEIHRLPRVVEELLYPAMEDFAVNFITERGLHARSIKHRLSPFTLVGATTRPGMLSAPLRERFGIFHHLDFYSEAELTRIVVRSASILGAQIDGPGAAEIARRSRGTPRIVNRLLRRVRDYAQVAGDGAIGRAVADKALELEGVDPRGLDRLDLRFIDAIIDHYQGGPVGIEAVAATINDEAESLIEMVEPYLLKIGFLVRTPAGRRLTARAYAHRKRQAPATIPGQGTLFE
ncbi:MAG TPA: Holliday junction branch migration DNA helicase RuvB [Candidatus Acidoferrum sp.]|nr:Holliday junction branch migration DNA helicase RuvB [Candidatus Acidoferrum sp.]